MTVRLSRCEMPIRTEVRYGLYACRTVRKRYLATALL